MATNKVVDWSRFQQSARRDQRKVSPLDSAKDQTAPTTAADTPSGHLSYLELLHRCQELLTEEEQQMTQLRKDEKSWSEIADVLGGTADSNRKRFQRCMDRISQELQIAPCQN